MGQFLGIDLGTSFFKAAVLDLDRREIRNIRRLPSPEPVKGLPPNRHELAPAAVLAAVRALLGELLADAPDARGLMTCSQMHCLVLTDAWGKPRSNVITWKDQRLLDPHPGGSGSFFEVLLRRLTPEERQRVGNEVRVGVPIGTLFRLAEEGQLAEGTYAASLPDFVLANLQTRITLARKQLAGADTLRVPSAESRCRTQARNWQTTLVSSCAARRARKLVRSPGATSGNERL
jgi:sugar (pentulose or hexulose) kinase